MALFRRSPKSSPPLRRRHEEIARQEAELRERLEKLERLVAKVPVIEKNRTERGPKDNRTDKRFRVGARRASQRLHRRTQDFPAPSFDAQRATRRPDHFSASCGGACRRSDLVDQQPAFVNNDHGRDFGVDVGYVARLARINLTEEEANAFQEQLDNVLDVRLEKLRQADVTHVEAAAHVLPIFNVFREDAASEWFTAEGRAMRPERRTISLSSLKS